MRTLGLFALILAATLSFAEKETVGELKARLDNAPVPDRAKLCVQIAQLQLRNADTLYTDGKVGEARNAVQDIVLYSKQARDAAQESRKHLKHVEIAVRKMAEKLADIKRTLAFEDQAPVGDAIQQLQDIRTSLLEAMFNKEKK
ncbi:MAG: hypothetical protein ACM3JD_10875 [Rudaea sp.]